MKKAIFTFFVTLIVGVLFMAIGNDFLNGFTEIGIIAAMGVMGGFIVYFNEKK